jgi:ABC-2 type transport system ATP-binding protein
MLADASTTPPGIPGQVLAHAQFGHEHVWIVRNLDEAQLENNCGHAAAAPYQVRSPSLEDILLALLREYRHPGKAIAPPPVVVTGIS